MFDVSAPEKPSRESALPPGALPRGRFAPGWRQFLVFGIVATLGSSIAGIGIWGLISGYPGPVFSVAVLLLGGLIVVVFWTLFLRWITVNDDGVQVSGPLGWPSHRIPMHAVTSFRVVGPHSASPAVELTYRGGTLCFTVDRGFARKAGLSPA